MLVTLVNPNVKIGRRLMRSYSGGYGDLVEEGDSDEIMFPPLELLRAAAVLRWHGADVTVCDLHAKPETLLPPRTDILVTTLSMPTWDEDVASAIRLKHELGAGRLAVLTSIADADLRARIGREAGADLVFQSASIAALGALLLDPSLPPPPDYLPPDRSMIDNSVYRFSPLIDIDPSIGLVTAANASFGCPYPCGYYCPYPAAEGTKFQPVPVPTLIAELEQVAALGIGGVVFRDPTFSLDMARAAEICDQMIARGLKLAWWCETRLDRLSDELLGKMAAAGCRGIEIGVESGDPNSQKRNTRKQLDLTRLVAVREHANRLGIKLQFLFIVGLPGDGAREIVNTYKFADACGLTTSEFNLSTITPYPGTSFYEDALANGWFEFSPERVTGYRANARTDRLTVAQIGRATAFGEAYRAALDRGASRGEIDALLAEMEAWAARVDAGEADEDVRGEPLCQTVPMS